MADVQIVTVCLADGTSVQVVAGTPLHELYLALAGFTTTAGAGLPDIDLRTLRPMAWFMTPHGPQSVIEPATITEFRRRDYAEITAQQAADFFAGAVEIPDVSFITGQELPAAMAAAAADDDSPFAVAQRAAFGSRDAPMDVLASTLANNYRADQSFYNLKAQSLTRTRAALGAAQFTGEVCRIAAKGDSQVGGTGSTAATESWPALLNTRFIARGLVSGAKGTIAAAYKETAADGRYAGTGWSAFVNDTTTVSALLQATNTNPLTYTSATAGTVVEVVSLSASSPFNVAVDGGAPVLCTPAGTNGFQTFTVTGLTNAAHTVTVTSTNAGGNLHIAHITVRDDSGIMVMNVGVGGSTARQWAGTQHYAAKQQVKAWAPHLVTVGLGTNDKIAGRTTAEYKTDMRTIITDYLTASDVLITTPVNSALDLAGYRQALYELADELDVPLFDVGDRFGTFAVADAHGLMNDPYHLRAAGNVQIALALEPILAG